MKLRYARQLGREYQSQVAQLFGVDTRQVQFRVGELGQNRAAEADYATGVITYDRDYLRNTSRADLRGNTIHELTHALGVGHKTGDSERIEALADYARYVLNPQENPNWKPSKAVLAIAERRGGPMTTGGPRLPGLGVPGGRKRQTLANMASHVNMPFSGSGQTNKGGAAALPSLSPAETANYYSQLSNLYSQYQLQRSSLKQQRIGIRADFRNARAQAQADKLVGLADAENAANDRGVLGSSADLQARADVRGQSAAAIAAAREEALTARAQTRIEGQQAAIGFMQGASQLEANNLAIQQERLAAQLEQNLIISGQEAQMNALKAMYDAIVGGFSNGGSTDTRRGDKTFGTGVAVTDPLDPRLFTNMPKSLRKLMKMGGAVHRGGQQ